MTVITTVLTAYVASVTLLVDYCPMPKPEKVAEFVITKPMKMPFCAVNNTLQPDSGRDPEPQYPLSANAQNPIAGTATVSGNYGTNQNLYGRT